MYAHEADEWVRAVHDMSEMDRAQAPEDPHAYLGVIGDKRDDR